MVFQTLPPGLEVLPEFITPQQEQLLLSFLATQKWRTDLKRRTLHFGGTYCLLEPRVIRGSMDKFVVKRPEYRTIVETKSERDPKETTLPQVEETAHNGHRTTGPIRHTGKRTMVDAYDASLVEQHKKAKNAHNRNQNPAPQIISADPMPPEFDFLMKSFIKHDLYPANNLPQYCIVNEYINDQGISAHVENFRFAEPVVGLSLVGGCYIRFLELEHEDDGSVRSRKSCLAQKTGRVVEVWLPRRSLMVMRGESRRKWQHEIQHNRKGRMGLNWKRVSQTFRVEKQAQS